MHNYGIYEHIKIKYKNNKELDMRLSKFKKRTLEIYSKFVKMKMGLMLSKEQKANRKLLSDVMLATGFYPLSHEWWHFNGLEKQKARQLYKIIE
jgi:D-alanyl-D-alanine dipeptidase